MVNLVEFWKTAIYRELHIDWGKLACLKAAYIGQIKCTFFNRCRAENSIKAFDGFN